MMRRMSFWCNSFTPFEFKLNALGSLHKSAMSAVRICALRLGARVSRTLYPDSSPRKKTCRTFTARLLALGQLTRGGSRVKVGGASERGRRPCAFAPGDREGESDRGRRREAGGRERARQRARESKRTRARERERESERQRARERERVRAREGKRARGKARERESARERERKKRMRAQGREERERARERKESARERERERAGKKIVRPRIARAEERSFANASLYS
jgi:hypothetical protein